QADKMLMRQACGLVKGFKLLTFQMVRLKESGPFRPNERDSVRSMQNLTNNTGHCFLLVPPAISSHATPLIYVLSSFQGSISFRHKPSRRTAVNALSCHLDVIKQQAHPEGGWGYTTGQLAQLEPTCFGILALGLDAERYADTLSKARAFLASCAGA